MMVAEGPVDMCAEPELSLGDVAANVIVVQEAAALPRGLDGGGPHSGDAAASNGLLHEDLLAYLAPKRD